MILKNQAPDLPHWLQDKWDCNPHFTYSVPSPVFVSCLHIPTLCD